MLLWYLAPSIVAVHDIFRSRGLDYRLIGLGALLPLAGRPARSGTSPTGTRCSSRSACSALVMLGTIGRPRLLRRRLICVPIGWMCGLVLSGAFLHDVSFLWPLLGSDFPDDSLVPPVTMLVLLDAAGLAIGDLGVGPLRPRPTARRATTSSARGRLAGAGRVILFVRHGETEANRQPPRARVAPIRRSPSAGNEQAAALAARLGVSRRRARCYSSPLLRARETAAPIARPRWAARWSSTTGWSSSTTASGTARASRTCRPRSCARWRNDPTFAPPGGESLQAVDRARRGLLHRAARRAESVVAVSHVSPIKAAVTWALGAGEELGWRMFLDLASITRIAGRDGHASLVGFNDTAHLIPTDYGTRLLGAFQCRSVDRVSSEAARAGRGGRLCVPVASMTNRPSPGPSATGMPERLEQRVVLFGGAAAGGEVVADDQRVRAGEQAHALELAEHVLTAAGEPQPRARQHEPEQRDRLQRLAWRDPPLLAERRAASAAGS